MLKFILSQRQHLRLANKYKNSKNDSDWIKSSYHSSVYRKQQSMRRILTDVEKTQLFNSVRFYYYN